jgi:hypothetical protein
MSSDLFSFLLASDVEQLEQRLGKSLTSARKSRVSHGRRIRELESGLGRVALLARSLAELCLAKGLITAEELRAQMLATDMEDGAGDGRLDPQVAHPGESKLADLEPIRPPTKPGRKRQG